MRISSAEWRRKAVHAGMGLFALLLRWLDWRAAAGVAAAALLFNLFAMPRIGRGIYRDREAARDPGIVAYPAIVLLLILLFRGPYLPIAAAVWAMMAFGDPAASLAGRGLGGPRLPWNRDKTWIGLSAGWAAAASAALLVFRFVAARPLEPAAVAILVAGAALFAFLETVPSGIDDNLVPALPTALAVYALSAAWPRVGLLPFSPGRAAAAAAVNALVAWTTWRLRVVAASGALAGAVVGALVVLFGGWPPYAVLWAFFLLGTAATKWGYGRKRSGGLAQADEGRRGAAHVVANCGVAVALLALGAHPAGVAACFAAALSDTLGTEFGTLYGRKPFSPTTGRTLPRGTPGAISWPGTLAGFAGAAAIGLFAAALGWISFPQAGIVAAAGLAGSLAESVANDLGRRFRFRLDHDFANALNTLVGALIALEAVRSLDAGRFLVPVAGS